MRNSLAALDFYKTGHYRQYPEGTEDVFSNLTPRKSRISGIDKVVFFGLQYYVIEYLINKWHSEFFAQDKERVVSRYMRSMDTSLGVGAVSPSHIEELHDLGYLPLEILALPEGSEVPIGVPMMALHTTNPKFYWLVNYIETALSASIWGMCTSATIAKEYRRILDKYCELTGGAKSFVDWQGHDFSYRGMWGQEAACMSGAGHLLSFTGTDTVPAIDFLEEYYDANAEKELIGGSVAATEHSVMCMGMEGGELETFRRLITEVYPIGIISIVSDSFDFWRVVGEYLPALKETIEGRSGKVVIRPDSGDPVKILTGYRNDELALNDGQLVIKAGGRREIGVLEQKGLIECLWDIFGGTVTNNGYKALAPCIGAIYGDSITLDRAEEICSRLLDKGFASTNIVLGIGSYTYTYVTRDTFGFAVKATWGQVNGESREIFKDPRTGDGEKKSAKGLLAVYKKGDNFVLKQQASWDDVFNCAFETVFKDGALIRKQSLSDIRQIIKT